MKLQKQLFLEYATMYRPYVNKLNELLAPFQIYLSHWSILRFLLQEGGQTVSEISFHKKVEKPTATKMIQKLLELGLAEVKTGADKRMRIIEISEYGHEICGQIQEKVDAYHHYLLGDIPEEEQLAALKVLQGISGKIGTFKEKG